MVTGRLETPSGALTQAPSRRDVLRGLAGAGLGLGFARLPDFTEAKKRRRHKPKRKKGLCQKDGSACTKSGKKCQKRYCLRAPFTIEAIWTQTGDHDAHLFVPPENETTGPHPYIHFGCTLDDSSCDEVYPFACFDGDETVSGEEVATIYRLLPGTYEYWIELDDTTPAGEVAIVLRDGSGRVVRRWTNPANATVQELAWHVFDIDGRDGRVTAIDALKDYDPDHPRLPQSAHDPNDPVCPPQADGATVVTGGHTAHGLA